MRFFRAFAPFATALLVGLAAPAVHGAQYANLSYTSDPGDFIGQGLSQNYTYATGNANINAQVLFTIGAAPKQATFLRFTLSSTTPGAPGSPPAFNVDVATNQLGGMCLASPAIHRGTLLFRTREQLVAIAEPQVQP